jgi:hypothetical protein
MVTVKLSFEVGAEKNRVDFSFDPIWGRLAISVDGVRRERDFHVFSMRLVRRYELTVGDEETHTVAIEKERKLFFAGFRRQQYRVFVDDRLVQEREGY